MRLYKKIFLCLCLFLISRYGYSQSSLTGYQYWFNNDFAGAVTVGASGNSLNLNTMLPTANVEPGVHVFHFRAKQANGKWSSVTSTVIIKQSEISAYEYWINDDYDQRIVTTVDEPSSDYILISDLQLPEAATNSAFYTLNFRARSGDKWSSVISHLFIKRAEISAYEYWINDDYDQRIVTTVDEPSTDYILIDDLPLPTYTANGAFCTLHFRARSGDKWSSTVTAYFLAGRKITGYEYWYASDPGNTFQVAMAPTEFMTTLPVLSATSVPQGVDTVYFRVKDEAGRWSSALAHSFTQSNAFELNVPYISAGDNTFFSPGEPVNVVGGLFTPTCLVTVNLVGPGSFTWTTTVVADTTGTFVLDIPTGPDWPLGYYQVQGIDACTQAQSQATLLQAVGVTPPEDLLVLHETLTGTTVFAGNLVTVEWTDKLLPNRGGYDYPTIPGSAWRRFDYLVEYWDGSTWQPADEVGGYGIRNIVQGFTSQFTINDPMENAMVRVRDGLYAPNMDESGAFTVAPTAVDFEVGMEWDHSWPVVPNVQVQGVAADGVARIYLKAGRMEGVSGVPVAKVQVELYDPVNQTTNADLAGRVKVATVLDTYSDEATTGGSATAVSTSPVDDKFWFWYVAPVDFTQEPLNTARERFVEATVRFYDAGDNLIGTLVKQIKVVRPPLALVHGLASSPEAFDHFAGSNGVNVDADPRFVLAHRFTMHPSSHFWRNAQALLGYPNDHCGVANTLPGMVRRMRDRGYACNQLDYVAHSMGGLIIRYAETEYPDEYKAQVNYDQGYVHKLITINSPHWGSSFADLAAYLPSLINDKLEEAQVGDCDAGDLVPCISDLMASLLTPSIPISGFFRKGQPEQVCTQETYNWLVAIFPFFANEDWATVLKYKLEAQPAVRDLRIVDGVQLQASNIRSHIINADLIPPVQNLPFAFDLFIDDQAISEHIGMVEEGWAWLDKLATLLSKSLEDPEKKERIEKLSEVGNTGLRYLNLLSTFIDWYNYGVMAYNTVAFIADCDIVVPLQSQLSGLPPEGDNVTSFAGLRHNHLAVLDQSDVGDEVLRLLNGRRNSTQFGGLFENPNDFHREVVSTFLDSLDLGKVKYGIDTTKVRIAGSLPTELWVDSVVNLNVTIGDTVGLRYVDLNFQGRVFRKLAKVGTLNYQVPVRPNLLDNQNISIGAYYEFGDSAKVYVDVKPVQVRIADPLTGFQANRHVVYMSKNDTVALSFRAFYGEHIVDLSSTTYNEVPSIDNGDLLHYDEVRNQFYSLDTGQTVAYIPYKGLVDTVYFVIGTGDIQYDSDGDIGMDEVTKAEFKLEIMPNPTRGMTTVTIPTPNAPKAMLEVRGLNGQLLKALAVNPGSEAVQLDLTHYPQGGYVLRYVTGDTSYTGVVIKL